MNLTVTELANKFSAFMKPEGSLPCSQKSAIRPHLLTPVGTLFL